jgi:hypothetical protein
MYILCMLYASNHRGLTDSSSTVEAVVLLYLIPPGRLALNDEGTKVLWYLRLVLMTVG